MNRLLTVSTVLLSLHVPVPGQQPLGAEDIPMSAAAAEEARRFRELKVSKFVVNKRVRKLTKKLVWHTKLDRALAASKRSGKPLVWIQALGRLTGYV
jgi:hypothetical protein